MMRRTVGWLTRWRDLLPDDPLPGRQSAVGDARSRLLAAALMLLVILKLNPFAVPWLAVKLVLLVAYVVLGVMALKRARTRMAKCGFYVAALACFGAMYSVARAHHPLGLLHGLLG